MPSCRVMDSWQKLTKGALGSFLTGPNWYCKDKQQAMGCSITRMRNQNGRAGGLIVIIGLGDCESNKHSVYHSLCATGNDLTRTLVFDAVCFLA